MEFLHALLAGDRLTRALARTGVGTGTLAADRQTATVAAATVARVVLEPLNVLLHLPTQGAFDHEAAVDDVHDAADLIFVEFLGLFHRIDVGFREDLHRVHRADAVDVTQADADLLVGGDVDTS